MKLRELKPIDDPNSDYEAIERKIIELFKKEIYLPLIRELGLKGKILKNSFDDLIQAVQTGKIVFYRGQFKGQFNSLLSRELKKLGAEWDRKQGSFAIPHSKLPIEIKHAISLSESQFQKAAERITKKLASVSPAEIAGKLKIEKLFDRAAWKVEKDFKASIKGITIAPTLTPDQVSRLSKEYTHNLQLYIADFVEKETVELRTRIAERSLAGFRYEGMVKEIEKSYGVSANKAKFLARQETNLIMAKLKQTRYEDAGVNEYKWKTVHNPHDSKNGPHIPGNVRYSHWVLDGKIFRWDDPPVVNEKGERKNPKQDYNCRCVAIPVVRF